MVSSGHQKVLQEQKSIEVCVDSEVLHSHLEGKLKSFVEPDLGSFGYLERRTIRVGSG